MDTYKLASFCHSVKRKKVVGLIPFLKFSLNTVFLLAHEKKNPKQTIDKQILGVAILCGNIRSEVRY